MSLIVTHQFQTPIPVVSRVDEYPSVGIQLEYNDSGNLVGIRHELHVDSHFDAAEAVRLSERQIGRLLQIIEFFYGFPPQIGQQRVEIIEPGVTATNNVGFATLTASAMLVGQVRLPAEPVLAIASPRLTSLLNLFNAARPPASHAEAVRLYYLVWEGLHGSPQNKGATLPEQRLKYTRDFVSHGCVLSHNKEAIAFIKSQIGKSITAFDPIDPDHTAFVAGQRAEARALIEAELKKQL